MEREPVIWPQGMHYSTFVRHLTELGYRWVDDGCVADVFINPKTRRAIKIASKTDAYILYAKTVFELGQKRKRKNPFLPRIFNLTIRSTQYMVEMELLKPVSNSPYEAHANKVIEALDRVLQTEEEEERSCPYKIADYILGFGPSLWEAAAIIGVICNESTRLPNPDTHLGNFMLRGKQLVITDPVCNEDSDIRIDLPNGAIMAAG